MAHAADPPPQKPARPKAALDVRARYEEGLIAAALLRHQLTPEPQPEGKIIERVIVDSNDVILPGDLPLASYLPWTLANKVHVRTRPFIISQELLFAVGQPYQADLFEESGRNLRSFFILSVARLVPVRGAAPGRIGILVVTKDQWSLRLNTNLAIDQSRLDSLSFSFSENNLAGRNKTLSVNFAMDAGRLNLGLAYQDPRVWSTRLTMRLSAGLYLARSDSAVEGGAARLVLGRPLYSLRTRFGWALSVDWDRGKSRSLSGGDLRVLTTAPFTFLRDLATGGGPGVWALAGPPAVYRYQTLSGALEGTYSAGLRYKFNLTAGLRFASRRSDLSEEFPADAPQRVRDSFTNLYMPRSEDASGPYLSVSSFESRFVRLQNIETFALSEDFRLGYAVTATLRYATPLLGLSSHFAEAGTEISYRHYFGDDLLTYAVGLSGRLQEGVYPQPPATPLSGWQLVNQDLSATLRNVSPRFGVFRLHVYGRLRLRARDLDNLNLTMGSDNGLRGFAPRSFPVGGIGRARYGTNVELRTTALNLWTLHVGAVAFYDGGDAPTSLLHSAGAAGSSVEVPPTWHQDVGVGLRILFPQFNRDVLRLDLAFPLEAPLTSAYAPRFSVEFGQAF